MENFKIKYHKDKYKLITAVLLITCIIMLFKNIFIFKNIELEKSHIFRMEKKLNSLKSAEKIKYGKIIDDLRNIKEIKISNLDNNNKKGILTASVELNNCRIEDIFYKIKAINGFYSIDNIKIEIYDGKNIRTIFNINFIQNTEKKV